MKKRIIIICGVVMFFMPPVVVMAGGVFVADSGLEIYQPDQKAIVSWNGEKQVTLLSTGLRAYDIANFAWVVPVVSSSKPVVTETGMEAHNYLAGVFRGKKKAPDREPCHGNRVEIPNTRL